MPEQPRMSIDVNTNGDNVMSTLIDIMSDKPRVSIDVNTNGDNLRQATREYIMSTLIYLQSR